MKRIFLFLAVCIIATTAVAQQRDSLNTSFNRWSVDFGIGLTKPYRMMSPGYSTNTPDFFAGDIGVRYMFNEYFGIRGGLGYNNFSEGESSLDFSTDQFRFDLQGVINMGRLMHFETWTQSLNLLAHGGFGLGFLNYETISDNDYVGNAIVGFTGLVKLSPRVALNVDGSTMMNVRQSQPFSGVGRTSDNESFVFNATVGLTFYLGKNKTHADWYVREDQYYNMLDSRIAELEDQIQQTRDEDAEKAKAKMDKLNQRIDDLDNELTDKMNSNKFDVVGDLLRDGYVNIYFDFNSSKINSSSADAVGMLRTYLQKNPNVNVSLVGYADERGSEEYNKELSEKRADAVADMLVKSGIAESRITTEGKGEDTSVDESSSNARQLARRVTFQIR